MINRALPLMNLCVSHVCVHSEHRLMGPRRKLSLAISEVKKQQEEEGGEGEGERGAETRREGERDRDGERERERGEREREGDGRTGRKTSRPPLIKQPSTELTAAYRQVRVRERWGGELESERERK